MKEYKICGVTKINSKYAIVHCLAVNTAKDGVGLRSHKVFVPADKWGLYIPGKYFTVRCRKYGDKWFEFSTNKITDEPSTEVFSKVLNFDDLPF